MNELWGHLIGVVIVLLMLSFIGIWIWAWLPRHRKTFDSLAQIPMEDPIAGPPLTVHGAPGAIVDGRFVIAGGASRAGGQSNTAWSALTQVLLELP